MKNPWIRIDLRRPAVIRSIQFYSPFSTNHGSALIVKSVMIKYRLNGLVTTYHNALKFEGAVDTVLDRSTDCTVVPCSNPALSKYSM